MELWQVLLVVFVVIGIGAGGILWLFWEYFKWRIMK